ncbi:MAG: CRTAC1 family protein [bacterium]|nr:CRTAC1 family protein [bacterium]
MNEIRRGAFLLCIVGVTAALFVACSGGDTGDPRPAPERADTQRPAGHVRMVNELRRISENMDSFPYLGSGLADRLTRRLAELPAGAPAEERAKLHLALGEAQMNQGLLRPAIDNLTQAYRQLPDSSIEELSQATFKLAVAYMRLGETQNCCKRNNPDSCILPLRGGGVHTDQEGSKNAIRHFFELMNNTPPDSDMHLAARWLFNVMYMTLDKYPDSVPERLLIPPDALGSDSGFPRFNNVSKKLGLDTFNLSGGAIVDDFDGDDDLDLVTSTWDPRGPIHFFRNNGNGTFADETGAAGLDGLYGGLNLKPTDYDNDGDLDVFVLRGAWLGSSGRIPNSLLRNNGDGTFTDVTFDSGLGDAHRATQAGDWADYDNDGDLDLFVGNESTEGDDHPCQLFRNNGDGTFTDVAPEAGVDYVGYIKGVTWGDYDEDRDADLFISEYFGENLLFRNNGDGTFTDVAPQLGVTRPHSSFPTWFWDYDNDGHLDLFVASYTGRVQHIARHYLGLERNYEIAALYRGDGRGGFVGVAETSGLAVPMLPMGSNYGDIDNDGFLDFYLGTGDPSYWNLMPNLLFHNRGGQRFEDVSVAAGMSNLQKGHSVAFADLDSDGDLDVFEQMGGAYPGDKYADALYENPGFGNHRLTVQLVGTRSNRAAIGARIHARFEGPEGERSVYRWVNSGGSFGGNPLRQTLGLGGADRVERLEIFWPMSGETQVLEDVEADRMIRVVEGEAGYTVVELKRTRLGAE